jgi:hypothetical protein
MRNSALLYWLQPKSLKLQPKAELVPVKVMKAYSGNRATAQRILNLAITRRWSASRPGSFYPIKNAVTVDYEKGAICYLAMTNFNYVL